jgi:hypothetical protein
MTELKALPHNNFIHTSCILYPISISLSQQSTCFDDDTNTAWPTWIIRPVTTQCSEFSFRLKYLLECTCWQCVVAYPTNTLGKWHFEMSACNLSLEWYEYLITQGPTVVKHKGNLELNRRTVTCWDVIHSWFKWHLSYMPLNTQRVCKTHLERA